MAEDRKDASTKQTKKEESTKRRQRSTPPKPADPRKELQKAFNTAYAQIREIIVLGDSSSGEIDISPHYAMSQVALSDYVTLDWGHYQQIESLMQVIREYARDRSRRRPLNIIMQAEPGSGKSHFIKCLAKRMAPDGIDHVTFNMASMQGVVDLMQPLEAVRNLKVVDKLPILFLDEFDSSDANYALLLPLLWDGELGIAHRELRLGKVVIILAGSGSQIRQTMKVAKSMQHRSAAKDGKLVDLLSRINGGELTIPALDQVSEDGDRRVDKVCISLSLLRQRFGTISQVPLALLKFIVDTRFQHGVRSISHLVDLIPPKGGELESLGIRDLRLPLTTASALKSSSLAYHILAEDGPAAVVELWRKLKTNEAVVRFGRSDSPLFKIFGYRSLEALEWPKLLHGLVSAIA